MPTINLADARARLSVLVARAEAGEVIVISRRGKPVAQLSAVAAPCRPIDPGALREVTDAQPRQEQPAGEFVRIMRGLARF